MKGSWPSRWICGGAPREATRTLSRLVILPALGRATALAHLRFETDNIVKPIDQAVAILRRYAAGQFATIVDADPTRFLIPAMARSGVTLESMAELYRQAGHVGAVPVGRLNTAAELFERVRDRAYAIKDPMFRKQSIVNQATADLSEVTGVLEEVNRVQGLALAIRAYDRPDRSFADLAPMLTKELDARRGTEVEGTTYVVFPE